MIDDLVFRLANEDDFLQLAQLRWEARAEGNGETPATARDEFLQACITFLREGANQGDHVSFVSARESLLISHLSVQRVRFFPHPAKVNDDMDIITENYTRPDFRNRGIGGQLLRQGIERAREQDFELLIVFPSERAVPFYERAGFIPQNDVMELRLREYYSQEWSKGD